MARPKVHGKDEDHIFIPPKRWGDQEQIRPINEGALHNKPTHRTKELALSKRDHRTFRNRPRMNHGVGNHHTITSIQADTLAYDATDRMRYLAHPKTRPLYVPNIEPEEIVMPFAVKPGALTAVERPRLLTLAEPKHHPDFTADIDLEDLGKVIPRSLTAKLTWRTHELSEPKRFIAYEDQFMAKTNECAPDQHRVNELARPKRLHREYVYDRTDEEMYNIPPHCLKARANDRTDELATPVQRLDVKKVRYNSQAFIIPLAALQSKASPRLRELAQPIKRR